MPENPFWTTLRLQIKLAIALSCLLLICTSQVSGQHISSNVVSHANLSISRQAELAEKLRTITGWDALAFDGDGALRLGSGSKVSGGSAFARGLLSAAVSGKQIVIVKDASHQLDVVFARVVEGRFRDDVTPGRPIFLILLDFADFSNVVADAGARPAFNEAWALLHELTHIVHDSADARSNEDLGECESLVNRMRRECGLAERADYYFEFLPGQELNSSAARYVRLAFDLVDTNSNKRKRYWVVWDAAIVGGLPEPRQIAVR